MYRDDRDALQYRLDDTTREADRLRQENQAMRAAVGQLPVVQHTTLVLPPAMVYRGIDVRTLPLEERARLAGHSLRPFPVWAVALLHIFTLGLFPLIHFGLQHDRLPRAANNDPSAGKAIGFAFIPYFNLYWVFFSSLRLCDRLTLQLRLRGLQETAPRGALLAASILWVIPYVNLIIGFPIMWTIAVCMLQSTINRVAQLSPTEWDATIGTGPVAMDPGYGGFPAPGYPQLPR